MKRFILITLIFALAVVGTSADEKGINLRPVPQKQLNSMTPAVMSKADFGFELPSSIDIGSNVLIPRSQGGLGSCASWAVASELTRVERKRNKWPVGKNISYFSPLYLYNQVNGGQDRGSSLYNNLNILVNRGCALFVTFPYIQDYRIQPTASAHREAARYKINEFKKLTVNIDSIKNALARGYGVVISFRVFDNFDFYSGGIYKPNGQSGVMRNGERFEFHGMTIIAYDDAFQMLKIINSWGENWGDKGFMYISYNDLESLVREAYIIVPKDSLPELALPPSNVQASKGLSRNKVTISWQKNSAEEYEIFRLAENEFYVSLGKTTYNFFEDTTVSPNQRTFYFVAAHKGEYMSELSFASEGWSNTNTAETPGNPYGFTVIRQGNNITASWKSVEGANTYQLYQFDDSINDFILVGETNNTNFKMTLPVEISSPVMTFFVLAKNNNGQSLPSETAVLTIEDWKISKEGEITDNKQYKKTVYKGDFYNFPVQRFTAIEKQAREYFKIQQDEFKQKFRTFKDQKEKNFKNQQNNFMNRLQRANDQFKGGR